jgi:hypothetical protein
MIRAQTVAAGGKFPLFAEYIRPVLAIIGPCNPVPGARHPAALADAHGNQLTTSFIWFNGIALNNLGSTVES